MNIHTICYFIFCLFCCIPVSSQPQCGAERLDVLLPLLQGKRVTLAVNQTSLCKNTHLLDTLCSRNINIVQVFAPEHGFRGNADAGETIKDGRDTRTGVRITSLYGKNKKPQVAQLAETDVVVFDIQDVGARFYTYISTLYYIMQACAENQKEMIVLDRPNPCDYIDGPILQPAFKSFVGMLPIPVLHGCTVGELAQMINGEGWLGSGLTCRLHVITVKGWSHGQPYSLTVKPSPNLPNDQAIALYPSLCPFEGTDISVGRGTTYPFQVIGSPILKEQSDKFFFIPRPLEGFDKNPLHKDQKCYGKDLRHQSAPRGLSLRYVIESYQSYCRTGNGSKFFTRPRWFDLLMGTDQVRKAILRGDSEKAIKETWQKELEEYRSIRKNYILYH